MLIRHADPSTDGSGCAAIYAPYVDGSAVSYEERSPTGAEMTARIAEYSERHPWLVAEHDGAVTGFAYAGIHRTRPAYRWSVEVSVYVAADARRRGVARTLYGALFPLLVTQRLHVAIAGITLPNPASIALHESMGFVAVGVYREIGYKAGAWRDVGMWQLRLCDPTPGEPLPPGPPARLPD